MSVTVTLYAWWLLLTIPYALVGAALWVPLIWASRKSIGSPLPPFWQDVRNNLRGARPVDLALYLALWPWAVVEIVKGAVR